jgi:hypothetical protein
VLGEFTASEVAADVVEHLERRRPGIVRDEAAIRAEVKNALVPVRRSYASTEMPATYMDALEEELAASLPARWRPLALEYTQAEEQAFGIWRRGDVLSRVVFVLIGFAVGGLPFIPFRFKLLPALLGIAAFWLPDYQKLFQRRRYRRELGDIVKTYEGAQKALDRHLRADLLTP